MLPLTGVAIPKAFSVNEVPVLVSATLASPSQLMTPFLGIVDETVMVNLKTNVPVVAVTALSSSGLGAAVSAIGAV